MLLSDTLLPPPPPLVLVEKGSYERGEVVGCFVLGVASWLWANQNVNSNYNESDKRIFKFPGLSLHHSDNIAPPLIDMHKTNLLQIVRAFFYDVMSFNN